MVGSEGIKLVCNGENGRRTETQSGISIRIIVSMPMESGSMGTSTMMVGFVMAKRTTFSILLCSFTTSTLFCVPVHFTASYIISYIIQKIQL